MASYLGNYLSYPRRAAPAKIPRLPSIHRYSPATASQYRATSAPPISAPFSTQDVASALLQQQQARKYATPSSTFDDTYNYDPIQAKIQALGSQSVANARTNAAQLRNQAAITEGDPDLLRSLGFDANTIGAAQNNPESLIAGLNRDYAQRQRDLADSEQNQNLYYSGEYQRNLSDMARGYASAQGSIGQKLRDLLSGADQGVLDASETARQQELQAQIDAQNQASYTNLYEQLLAAMNGGSGATGDNASQTLLGPQSASAGAPIDTSAINVHFGAPLDNPGLAPSAPTANFDPTLTTGFSNMNGYIYDPVTGKYIPNRRLA